MIAWTAVIAPMFGLLVWCEEFPVVSGPTDRAVPAGIPKLNRTYAIRRVGTECVIDPRPRSARMGESDEVGVLTIHLKVARETKGLLLPDARIAFVCDQSFTLADHRELSERATALPVFAPDGSVVLTLVDDPSAGCDERWWNSLLRKPPGTYRVWFASVIAGEIELGASIASMVGVVGFGAWVSVWMGVYGARAGARKCIACGYPVEAASQRCSECGSERPPWRGDTDRAVKT